VTVTVDIRPGAAGPAVDRRLAAWSATGAGRRIWDRDPTLWLDPPRDEITNRLGWLDLPARDEHELRRIEGLATAARTENVEDVVLLGMGGSSLAPEVYASVFGSAPGHPRLTVLDSTHPAAVAAVADTIEPARTLFIVASKSGTTLETLSFFRLMWSRASAVVDEPGERFVAITDPGSSLIDLAAERRFRAVFEAPPDVGGRFSALSVFGLVPAGMIGVDVPRLLDRAAATAAACGPDVPVVENPALRMGATLGESALMGRDKAVFLAGAPVDALPIWAEQLVAESLGKDGTGIVPVVGGPADPDAHPDRLSIAVQVGTPGTRPTPGIDIALDDLYDLGGAMFMLEMATAMTGAVLGVHPFDQPNVQLAKEMARTAMSEGLEGLDTTTWDLDDDLTARLSDLFETAGPGTYAAIQAYLAPTPAVSRHLASIRTVLEDATGAAVTPGYGPRFLHSTGQLHKGGPASGVFLQIADRARPDLDVPETDYSFGELIAAQAAGDQAAIHRSGRPVAMVQLGDAGDDGLDRLLDAIRAATA